MQSINLPSKPPSSPHPVLNLGFRIFFLSAGVFAILSMLKWSHITFATKFMFDPINQIMPFYWHGHEMIYGYGLALIAGFLLTAVKTWTNQPMPYGYKLLAIFLPWAAARLIYLINGIQINGFTILAGVFDIGFWLLTAFFVIKPIYQVRQKRQIGIVAKLMLLLIGQLVFYYALANKNLAVMQGSLLAGFYLIVGVVFTIGRRVMPMFIERGIAEGGDVVHRVKNSPFLDKLSLVAFFAFFIGDVFLAQLDWSRYLIGVSAVLVAVTNLLRLKNWHLPQIWSRPLLWSLWLSFFGMALGFLLLALYPWGFVNHSLAMHAVSLAGVGLMTLAMMSRVSLGHTGRSVHKPPKTVGVIFVCMVLVWLSRVVLGWVASEHYFVSLGIAQGFWILAFLLFVVSYAKILLSPRTDGLFG
ncbi:NnrS family protein [Moraxella macacae 0408225]|uniref:NnrS family protein n=1 Tax=Moraxella macacae 0408225 TaxID=1230338 RepID=L2F9A0_9GAMM|nr:NnrS family protein [Moraxella macacae]ELA09490.1 NnrS family protein [Moraxella macacae 0408225]